MDILGVGPLEFVLILVLMLLLLGPKGMVKLVRDVGQFLKSMVQSPIWKSIVSSSQEIRQVQTQIIKESGLDESLKEIRATTRSLNQMTNDLVKPALDEARVEPVALNVPKPVADTKPPADTSGEQVLKAGDQSEPIQDNQQVAPLDSPSEPQETAPTE